MVGTLAVIIPIYGMHEFTSALIQDLMHQACDFDVYVVDNLGDYVTDTADIITLTPGSNLGWAGGCNYALENALARGYDQFMLLNNDTQLSPSFVSGMLEGSRQVRANVMGPSYDHKWPQQRLTYSGPAELYKPRSIEARVPFIDGTCMMISRATLDRVGMLDTSIWPQFGWGCDKDYCLRVRSAGGNVWVTRRSYLNHIGRGTATGLPGFSEVAAECENDDGMARKWGEAWKDLLYEGFDSISRLGPVQQRLTGSQPLPNYPTGSTS
jgi:GT2 family glycosyltransferase